MYPTIKQFLEAVGTDRIQVVNGNALLEQKILRGGQAAEGIEAWKEIEYGELLFTSGIGFQNVEDDLLHIIEMLKKKEASLVLRLGGVITEIPEGVVSSCQEQNVVLLAMPEEIKLQPVMRKMYEVLFQEESRHESMELMVKNLIQGTYSNEDAQNAYRLGFEAGEYYVAAVLMPDDFFNVIEKTGRDYYQELQQKLCNRLEQILELRKRSIHFSAVEGNEIIVLIKNEDSWLDREFLQKLFGQLTEYIEEKDMKITVSMGVGTPITQLTEIRRSVTEARRSLQIVHACQRQSTIRSYDDIGIYRLLFELQDQEEFGNIMNGIIGRLKEYDLVNNENLVETLRIYLENDRNIGTSAAQMFLHRNTLKYRLKKIEEILMCDLSDVNTCFNLRLAFKIECFLQSEKTYYS